MDISKVCVLWAAWFISSAALPAPGESTDAVNTSAFSSLAEAAASATGKTLIIDSKIVLGEDTTVTVPNGRVVVQPGGMILARPGTILTFNCPFSAPAIPVFSKPKSFAAPATVRFAAVNQIYPEWWGAVADGTTDNTGAFQRMFDATYDMASGSYRAYTFQAGRYLLKGTVTLDPQPVSPVNFGIQSAPTLLGADLGVTANSLPVATTFVKNTGGPMFVIGGVCGDGSDDFKRDGSDGANPRYLTVERIRFMSTLAPGEVRQIRPMGIVGQSRRARIQNSIFAGLWSGVDMWGESDSSIYDNCVFDCYQAAILRSPDSTEFLRCQFGGDFVSELQKGRWKCGPPITSSGGEVKLTSCRANF